MRHWNARRRAFVVFGAAAAALLLSAESCGRDADEGANAARAARQAGDHHVDVHLPNDGHVAPANPLQVHDAAYYLELFYDKVQNFDSEDAKKVTEVACKAKAVVEAGTAQTVDQAVDALPAYLELAGADQRAVAVAEGNDLLNADNAQDATEKLAVDLMCQWAANESLTGPPAPP